MLIRKRPQVIPGGGGRTPCTLPLDPPLCAEHQTILKIKSHSALTLSKRRLLLLLRALRLLRVTPSTSHEAIEDVQLVEEAEVEEEEEYDTDSDAEYPIADNYEVDSLDDLLFLRAVTTRSGRMVRVVHRE